MARSYHRSITTPAAARMSRPAARPFVSLLTDFGDRDPSAGIMRAVVLGIAPEAIVVDISHEVEKYAVRDGALLIWCALPYMPVGAHVAVVDPGVGTDRRPIAIETARGDYLVGPDNGILLPGSMRLGGVVRVHTLENPQFRLPVISSSFHGRDLFAPAAAHLSVGVPLEFMGPAIDPRSLVPLDWPEPQVYEGLLRATVIYLDTFGNAKLSALGGDLLNALGNLTTGEWLHVRIEDGVGARDVQVPWAETFGNVAHGQPLLYEDSYGRLCLAVNRGSAVAALGIGDGALVTVTRVPLPQAEAAYAPPVPAYEPPPLEPEPAPEPVALAEPEPELQPEPQTFAFEPEPEPEAVAGTWPAVDLAGPSAEPEAVFETQPAVEPQTMFEPEPEPEPESAIPEPEPVLAEEPAPEPEPATSTSDPEPAPRRGSRRRGGRSADAS